MKRTHSLLARLFPAVGLAFLACTWTPAMAAQHILACDTDGQSIPAHSSALVHCESPAISLATFNFLTIQHAAGDASASSNALNIQSIEVTLNLLDAGSSQVDFIDLAFSPYANVDAGGHNATFGGINTPGLTILKSTLANDPIAIKFATPVVSVEFQLQVFVENPSVSAHTVSESLRVIASY